MIKRQYQIDSEKIANNYGFDEVLSCEKIGSVLKIRATKGYEDQHTGWANKVRMIYTIHCTRQHTNGFKHPAYVCHVSRVQKEGIVELSILEELTEEKEIKCEI